jgi:two-component system response regulator DesR
LENQNQIPLHTHRGAVRVATKHATAEKGAKRLRTIVADDSSTFLEVVCALLELDEKVDIVARVGNGPDVLEAVAKLHPDLLLIDTDLPSLERLNAATIIASQLPSTRVVLMSGDEPPEIRADAQAYGAESFIYKPRFQKEFREALGFQ